MWKWRRILTRIHSLQRTVSLEWLSCNYYREWEVLLRAIIAVLPTNESTHYTLMFTVFGHGELVNLILFIIFNLFSLRFQERNWAFLAYWLLLSVSFRAGTKICNKAFGWRKKWRQNDFVHWRIHQEMGFQELHWFPENFQTCRFTWDQWKIFQQCLQQINIL